MCIYFPDSKITRAQSENASGYNYYSKLEEEEGPVRLACSDDSIVDSDPACRAPPSTCRHLPPMHHFHRSWSPSVAQGRNEILQVPPLLLAPSWSVRHRKRCTLPFGGYFTFLGLLCILIALRQKMEKHQGLIAVGHTIDIIYA